MSKLINTTKVKLTNVRLSYPHLFEAYAFNEGQDPKYSASFIISKDDKKTLNVIWEAIGNVYEEEANGRFRGKKKNQVRFPLRDGDTDKPDNEEYKNSYFINANSFRKPQVVDRYLDPKTRKPVELTEEEVYPGCYVTVTLNFYPYSVSGNTGIAAGLGNVQKYSDGERLDGTTSASQDFDFEEPGELGLGSEDTPDDDFLS